MIDAEHLIRVAPFCGRRRSGRYRWSHHGNDDGDDDLAGTPPPYVRRHPHPNRHIGTQGLGPTRSDQTGDPGRRAVLEGCPRPGVLGRPVGPTRLRSPETWVCRRAWRCRDIERGGEFRWRAQSPDGVRRSASWRIWTAKNLPDIYIAQRQLAGTIKISLHADGNFQAGFVSNDVSIMAGRNPRGSRHLDKWRRPPEFAHGGPSFSRSCIPKPSFAPSRNPGSRARRW